MVDDGSRPNVLLLVVDACRADHVTGYPGGPDATPRIGAFADEATIFERALSPAPWTLPSLTSLLTGLDAHEHGASSRGYALDRGDLLQRQLSRAGYRAIHVSPTTWLGDWLPQGRGFDVVREFTGPEHRRREDGADVRELSEGVARGWRWYATVARRALRHENALASLANACSFVVGEVARDAWLDDAAASLRAAEVTRQELARAARAGEPFFCLVHLMDPHLPFYVPGRFRTDDVRPPGCESFEHEVAWTRDLMEDVWAVRNGERRLEPGEKCFLRTRYRDELAVADEAVGRVLDHLDDLGLADDTLVAVTADHGEHLAETVDGRDLVDHQASVRLPVLHVPLLLRLPGVFEDERRRELVQTHDLAPTIRALTGLGHDERRPLHRRAGHPRTALASYAGVVPSHPPEEQRTPFLHRARASAVADGWKTDLAAADVQRALPEPGDLGEARVVRVDWDRSRAEPASPGDVPADVRERLEARLAALSRSPTRSEPRPTDVEPSPQLRRRLHHLGYLE